MPFEIIIRSEDDEPLFIRTVAVRMARVTPDFLLLCERQGLVRARTMTGGGEGFDRRAVDRLAMVRRLHEDLDLDLDAIELVVHLRRQIDALLRELDTLEWQARRREIRLLKEIRALRKRATQEAEVRSPNH